MKEKNKPGDSLSVPNSNIKSITEFLPSPEELIQKEETEKTTLLLDKSTLDFFRGEAFRLGVSYQKMIRNLLKLYVAYQKKNKDRNT